MKFIRLAVLVSITFWLLSCSCNRVVSQKIEDEGIIFELARIEGTTPPKVGFDVTLTITNDSDKDYWFYNLWIYFARVYHEDKLIPLRRRPQWINFNDPQYTLVKTKSKIVIHEYISSLVNYYDMKENSKYELEISYEIEDDKLFKRVFEGPIKSNRIKYETGSLTGVRYNHIEIK